MFVKAVGSGVNADSLRFYRAERDAALRIPRVDGILLPSASADLQVNGESYTVMIFPALRGAPPHHPWRLDDLTATMSALRRISDQLSPSPWAPEAGDRRIVDFFSWWRRTASDIDDPWRDNPWVTSHHTDLCAAEDRLRSELPGRTLSHADVRADNLFVTAEGVWFVDWAHAQNAAPWVDAGLLMVDVIASCADVADGGEIDVAAVIREQFASTVSFATVWRMVVGLAGAMHGMSRQPSPPGLPTIRTWQARTAETLLAWSQRESADWLARSSSGPDGEISMTRVNSMTQVKMPALAASC